MQTANAQINLHIMQADQAFCCLVINSQYSIEITGVTETLIPLHGQIAVNHHWPVLSHDAGAGNFSAFSYANTLHIFTIKALNSILCNCLFLHDKFISFTRCFTASLQNKYIAICFIFFPLSARVSRRTIIPFIYSGRIPDLLLSNVLYFKRLYYKNDHTYEKLYG